MRAFPIKKTDVDRIKNAKGLCSLLSVILFSVSLVSCFNPNERKMRIKEKLAPLCKGRDYVYEDIEVSRISMSYSESVYSVDGKLCDMDFYQLTFLFFSNDSYYFWMVKHPEPGLKTYSICKTDCDLSDLETIYDLGINAKLIHNGANEIVYVQVDEKYLSYNLSTSELNEIKANSEEEQIVHLSREKYWEYFGYYFGKYKKQNDYLDGVHYSFDEKKIDDNVLQEMNSCGFEPTYYFVSSSGKIGILYYARIDYSDIHDCLIIRYDSNSENIISYNLFHFCDKYTFRLYPNIDS